MTEEELRTSVNVLLNKLSEGREDTESLQSQLCAKIESFHALGLPVPSQLRKIEAAMETDAEDSMWDNMPV